MCGTSLKNCQKSQRTRRIYRGGIDIVFEKVVAYKPMYFDYIIIIIIIIITTKIMSTFLGRVQ